ncbi:MAG: hypothetical protein LBV32_01940 [Tannerellaceae bacterium]|nr:hypothetical protein [Tannerellaceae bacterium]
MKRLLFFALAVAMMLGGAVNSAQAQDDVFLFESMQGGARPNEPGSIHLEAQHYGFVLSAWIFNFYLVDMFTRQTVGPIDGEGYNEATVTLIPPNGKMSVDLPIKVPEGRYAIYYHYRHGNIGGTGYFWNFVVGNPPPLPVPIGVKNMSIKDNWLSTIDDDEPAYFQSSVLIGNKSNTITLYPREWHGGLADAEATVELTEAGSLFLNGSRVEGEDGITFTFRADFTKDVTLKAVADDDGNTKEYAVDVYNPDGSHATLYGPSLIRNGEPVGETTNSWGSSEVTITLPAGMPDEIGNEELEFDVGSTVNSTVKFNGHTVNCKLRYSGNINGGYSYSGRLDGFKLADAPYTITVTSPDGTVTKTYTLRIAEAAMEQDKAVWVDEQYMNTIDGFAYADDSRRELIEDPVPIDRLGRVAIQLRPSDMPEYRPLPEGQIVLRPEGQGGMMDYMVADYPQPWHNSPEIYFMEGIEITPGRYEVILLARDLQQEYTLGGITLTDEAPVFYGINVGTFAGGNVSVDKETSTAGKTINLWVRPDPEHELQSIKVTGKDGNPLSLTDFGAAGILNDFNYTFIMPDCDVTVTATFCKMTDESAIEAAKARIASAYWGAYAGSASDPEGLKEEIAFAFNEHIARQTGFTITTADIEIGEIVLPSGSTKGSYTFTIRLAKGNATGVATEKEEINLPAYYEILTPRSITGGYVSPSQLRGEEGTPITLELNAYTYNGYEPEAVTVYKATDRSVTVPLTSAGENTYTFTMPAYTVIIEASFRLTDSAQQEADEEAVEAAKDDIEAVESGTYRITQVTGNTPEEIVAWLRQTLGLLFAEKHNMHLRSSEETPITGELKITQFTAAIAGTAKDPDGTDGSFRFTVELTRNGATQTTGEAGGVITAERYDAPPPPTSATFTITASSDEHGTITPEGALKVEEGSYIGFTFMPYTDYEIAEVKVDGQIVEITSGSYTFTNISADHTIAVTFRRKQNPPTANTEVAAGLKVRTQDGQLHVSGLTPGESWIVYSMTGVIIRQGIAADSEVIIPLSARGVYILKAGKDTVKITN